MSVGPARFVDDAAPGWALLPLLPAVALVALGWRCSIKNGRKGVPGQA